MRSYPVQEAFNFGGSIIYGRAHDMNRIVEFLSSEDGTNISSTVVSIVADRGTGRTTLLHLLHSKLCNAFDTGKFISIPENFDDEKGLMRVIIESLTEFPCDITDLELLKETMIEELKDQRILLLLDDFENKSQECWDLLFGLLKVCKETSAVVVTATRESVAKVKGPMQFYYMNNLSNYWCWMIFKQGVFSAENPNVDAELADVGKLLVAKCKNVTLCIKVLSSLLRRSITDSWWRTVLNSNFWEMDEVDRDILPALRVCYEYLPSHLKQCFKYCSLFPKEYIFSKRHLVCLWMSQGFIEQGDGRELEDVGTEYFDELLSLSFFRPSLIHGTREDKFVMPGLIHDLARLYSKNECFQFQKCLQKAPEYAYHLSLLPHEFQSVSLSHLTRAQNLQTFLVVSRSGFNHQSISSSIIRLVQLKNFIIKFHSLITLNLNNTDLEELPGSIGSLTSLRYLGLGSTKIKRIPPEISNLVHLQILDAKDCHYLEELPRSIEALTNLRYLDVTKETGYVIMPRGIGKLTHLRSLATFNVGMDPLLHCGIEELKDMEYLKGCIQISGLVNVRCGNDATKAHMRSKQHIETLCFHWSDGMSLLEGEDGAEVAEGVLQSLHPTDNLEEIIVRDFPGYSFPMWIECAAFTRLVSVIFDHCYNCERLPALGGLPLLRFLSIQKLYCVHRMNLSGTGYFPENSIKYPALEQLNIWEMYALEEWVEIGSQDFPLLRSLCVSKCPLLKKIPKFPALVELSIYSSANFVEVMDLPSLHFLRIEGVLNMKSIRVPKNLVGLKILEINQCPGLLSIEGLALLNSLETIIVFRCPQLYTGDMAKGHKEIKELKTRILKQDRKLVKTTLQRFVKVQDQESVESTEQDLRFSALMQNAVRREAEREGEMNSTPPRLDYPAAFSPSCGSFADSSETKLDVEKQVSEAFVDDDEQAVDNYTDSVVDSRKAIQLDPSMSKAYFHKGKRPRDNLELVADQYQLQTSPKRVTSFSLGTMTADTIIGASSSLELMMHKVTCDEMQQIDSSPKPLYGSQRFHCKDLPTHKLVFANEVPKLIYTGYNITGTDNNKLEIQLVDINTSQICSRMAPIKVKIVVIDGDLEPEGLDSDKFSSKIIKEREGKRPLLVGNTEVTLNEGVGNAGDIHFTDNSIWLRSGKFRLGVCVDSECCGTTMKIQEGLTEKFTVRDYRGELYKKQYPPMPNDAVWRLEIIAKDGSYHQRLMNNGINTVQDFLERLNTNPNGLKEILQMSTSAWKKVVKHARTCPMEHNSANF